MSLAELVAAVHDKERTSENSDFGLKDFFFFNTQVKKKKTKMNKQKNKTSMQKRGSKAKSIQRDGEKSIVKNISIFKIGQDLPVLL